MCENLRLPRESVCREERKSYRIKSWGTLIFRYLVRAERTIKRKKNYQRGKEERYITLVKRRVAQEWGVSQLWHATERKVKGINWIWQLWRLYMVESNLVWARIWRNECEVINKNKEIIEGSILSVNWLTRK